VVNLLISTDRAILRYDTNTRETFIVDDSRPIYYGISWFGGDDRLFLTHSGPASFGSAEGYMRSEVGTITDGFGSSGPIVSNPHQICCLEKPYLAAANTGRNSLAIINTDDWSVRQHRFDDVFWDRFDPAGQGSHYNSVTFDGKRLYILAHNFDAGSYELSLEWPELDKIERRALPGRQMHNLWRAKPGQTLVCHSPDGTLVDVDSGVAVWRAPEGKYYTRGLASTDGHIYIGCSQFAPRGERQLMPSRIFVVEVDTYATVDEVSLGTFGGVNEIRVLDAPDHCHPVGPRAINSIVRGSPATDYLPKTVPPVPNDGNSGHVGRGIENLLDERDHFRDRALEAEAQYKRIVDECLAMTGERDAAWARADEAESMGRLFRQMRRRKLRAQVRQVIGVPIRLLKMLK
jgi:hypothetical protein